MKIAWTILLITAFTDLVITMGTSLGTAMVATGSTQIPTGAVWLLSGIGGAVAAARTIQQALKSSAETTATLTGTPAPRV